MESETIFTYEIRVEEHLPEHWSEWLNGLVLSYGDQNETILIGTLLDQAALYGVLMRIRDLGLTLVAVRRIECEDRNECQ
jgi:hypothetical protein